MEVAKAVGGRQQKEQKGGGSWTQKAKSQCRDLGEKAVGHLLGRAGVPKASLMVVGLLDAPQAGAGQPKGQRYRGRWEDGGN